VIVAQDNNASDGQRAPVNRGHITRQNGQQGTKCLNFSGEKPSTPILDTINYPMHMKNLSLEVKVFKMMLNFQQL
jgi:1-deoxy-D-xylulose-5-phosphate synthase